MRFAEKKYGGERREGLAFSGCEFVVVCSRGREAAVKNRWSCKNTCVSGGGEEQTEWLWCLLMIVQVEFMTCCAAFRELTVCKTCVCA